MHQNRGKSVAECLSDRTDYAKNPDKTNNSELISAYECDPHTADAEFLYAEYYSARSEMRELLLHKSNVEQILGKEPANDGKKKEHDRS